MKDFKFIEKKSVVELPEAIGSISDTLNVADKEKNTYSANIIDGFNTYSTNEVIVGYFIKSDGTKVPKYRKIVTGTLSAPDINGTNWINIITGASGLINVSGTIGARPYNNDIVLRNGVYVLALDVAISGTTIMYRNLGVAEGSALNLIIEYIKD